MTFPIIVVDDDEVDRYLVKRAVTKWDRSCKVIEVADGENIITMVEDPALFHRETDGQGQPAVVLLDINMPGLNGFDVLDAIQQRFAEDEERRSMVVVMMFTSSDNVQDQERALSYDFVKDYIVKPLDGDDLNRIIRRHAEATTPEAVG